MWRSLFHWCREKVAFSLQKAQLFRKFLPWVIIYLLSWFPMVSKGGRTAMKARTWWQRYVRLCLRQGGNVFIVLSSLHMGVVPEKLPWHKTFPKLFPKLRECSFFVTPVPNFCAHFLSHVAFFTSEPLRCCCWSKVTPTSTTSTTFIYLFKAPHLQTPPKTHTSSSTQFPACVPHCPRQVDWQLITVTDLGRLYFWHRERERAACMCILEKRRQ